MKKHLVRSGLCLLLLSGLCGLAWAAGDRDGDGSGDADRIEHFEGKPAQTIEAALENLHVANRQLELLLASQSLDAEVSYEIHQLTYTLENALERLEDELAHAQETLERVHLASEANQGDVLATEGPRYLELSQRLFGPNVSADHP